MAISTSKSVSSISYNGVEIPLAIPEEYVITTDATAEASDIAEGKTAYANGVKLLGTAVFGGGLPDGIEALDFGEITISSAFTTTRQTFNHNLGVTPDLMIVYAPANIVTTYSMLAAIRGGSAGFGWRSGYTGHMAYHGNSTSTVTWTNSNSSTYGVSNMMATTFQLASASSSYYWRAGIYKYIAIKFS